ncbi:hypothetical protein P5P86_19590 [Nocardioides sp. BP30]|uniref:protein NO VEIN domain-containing protein n=1 Tax=Nocardioides sp. BP30 TaxID=3036374 RepID=UPI00246981CA|nr:DUF3883 domain-containing protein [Nocardioides sp. BP30]WGL52142.1 hypothetical protein P5P86_19590 [Nocardioides sp. BP30]
MEPTRHQLAAAVQVARFIDAGGNHQSDARDSYRFTATDQAFSPDSLRAGEGLLIAAGLLRLVDGRLIPTPALANFAAIGDGDEAANALAGVVAERADAVDRAEAGAAGEEFVLACVRRDLETLHRSDLAARCERVSLVSDFFGYDVAAPTLGPSVRRLEVKTQTTDLSPTTMRFYLTRHEYDIGRANPSEWALVACTRSRESGSLALLGWCRASTLATYLPVDQGGKWTEALVTVPVSVLTKGFPAAI